MKISILYFARFRELLESDAEQLEIADSSFTVDALIQLLGKRGNKWQTVFTEENLLVALNQSKCSRSATIKEGDEVAFFPPVTGG